MRLLCRRTDHIPEYATSQERLDRMDRLRSSVMSAWEGALMWGEGNYLTRTPAPMVVGMVDVMTEAQRLVDSLATELDVSRLQKAIDRYLRDLDVEKRRSAMEAGR